jgi:hypothetical protein
MMKQLTLIWLITFTCCGQAATQDSLTPHESWSDTAMPATHKQYLPGDGKVSQRRVVSQGPFTSYQVNVNTNGQNISNDAANEPSIAVNPLNPQQIVIGWRQFDNIASDFRQAGLAWSDDGGQTWHNAGPLEPGVFRSDPVLAADADGTFFYQSLSVRSAGGPGIEDDDFSVEQWRSVDGGQTWFDKTDAVGGDKSWYAIDTGSDENRGNLYAAWNLAGNNHYPNSFNYSVDNGMSWSSPVQIPKSPIFGTVAVGFDGEVYVAGIYGESNLSDFQLIRSNNPLSTLFPDFNQVTGLNLGGSLSIGGINPVGLLGQVWVATDRSDRHTRGRLYVAASVDRFGGDPLDLTFIKSLDGGLTFSNPRLINDDASFVDWQWFGTMGVAPNGRIDLVWLDTRNFGTTVNGKSRSQLYYSYSYDGGVSFAKNQAVSPDFSHNLGYPVQRKMGDYIDIVSDNRGAHVAYTATYTGGQDVYYLHAKPAAFEENPYFPGHELDGIWHNPDVPRQGIISKTLVQNPQGEEPQLVNFAAVFTEDPAGNPTWMVLQTDHPLNGDQLIYTALYPTGDLTTGGTSLRPIGQVTVSRLYDEAGETLKNQLHYAFDLSESAREAISGIATFSADFFTANPFYGTTLEIQLEPVISTEQSRLVHCLSQNLVNENPLEEAEGRVPVVFSENNAAHMFVADFTYQKNTEPDGAQPLVLNNQGLAIPTWQTSNTLSGDWLSDQQMTTVIARPNGGNGFFQPTTTDPGLTEVGTETLTLSGDHQLTAESDSGAVEVLNAVAFNSYCGTGMNP